MGRKPKQIIELPEEKELRAFIKERPALNHSELAAQADINRTDFHFWVNPGTRKIQLRPESIDRLKQALEQYGYGCA